MNIAVGTVQVEDIPNKKMKEEAEILKKKEEMELRRIQIRKILSRHAVSISSLKSLSEKQTRQEETSRAIPEGNEDDEDEDESNDDNDDSIEKTSTPLSSPSNASTDLDESYSGSSDNNFDTENGDQHIKLRRRRGNVFHRMTRFVVRGC